MNHMRGNEREKELQAHETMTAVALLGDISPLREVLAPPALIPSEVPKPLSALWLIATLGGKAAVEFLVPFLPPCRAWKELRASMDSCNYVVKVPPLRDIAPPDQSVEGGLIGPILSSVVRSHGAIRAWLTQTVETMIIERSAACGDPAEVLSLFDKLGFGRIAIGAFLKTAPPALNGNSWHAMMQMRDLPAHFFLRLLLQPNLSRSFSSCGEFRDCLSLRKLPSASPLTMRWLRPGTEDTSFSVAFYALRYMVIFVSVMKGWDLPMSTITSIAHFGCPYA